MKIFFYFNNKKNKIIIYNNKYKIKNLLIKNSLLNINRIATKNEIVAKTKYLLKGLNNFLNSGKKIFIFKNFNFYSQFFYLNIIFNNKKNLENFSYFNEIKSAIKENSYLNSFINLLFWYLNYFNFIFYLKNNNVKSKNSIKISNKKKNIENNKNYKISFVAKKKRNLYFFKWLKNFFFLNYNKSFFKTFFNILTNTFLNFKNSSMYKYKLLIYKQILTK